MLAGLLSNDQHKIFTPHRSTQPRPFTYVKSVGVQNAADHGQGVCNCQGTVLYTFLYLIVGPWVADVLPYAVTLGVTNP
jgi:hypothetical protein